ncbi:MAG: hypothetical protein DRJ14_09755 [Acidobacteria bacterium]|nr:MAG: hypothetical protein DRJ14_09755 [Acidobacteriota bacterium]
MQQNAFCKTRRLCNSLIIFSFLAMLPFPGRANPALKSDGGTGLTVSIGYVSTSGNSETTTGNFKSDFHTRWGRLHFKAYGAYLFTDVTNQESGVKSRDTEKIEAGVKTDYSIAEKSSIFTNIVWRKDEPSGIDHNISLASGYGRTFFDTDQSMLKGGAGLEGFQEEKLIDGSHITDSALAIYFQVDYRYRFSKNNTLKFSNESRMSLSDNNDYRVANALSYVSAINHTLALEISYQHNYKNLPVNNKRKTDSTTTVNLVFHF